MQSGLHMNILTSWLQAHQILLVLASAGSLLLFFGTLVFITVFIARMPADYFTRQRRSAAHASHNSVGCYSLLLLKNVLGIVLIFMGISMLVLPGQGVLTILIGLALTNFPGKSRLELRLVRQPSVFKSLNWIRRKTGRPPLYSP